MNRFYRNQTTNKIERTPIKLRRTIKDKDGNDISVTTFTNNEEIILAAGYEVFTPPKAKPADSNNNKLK